MTETAGHPLQELGKVDLGAGRDAGRGVRPHLRPRHPHPGRLAHVLVAMNPAARAVDRPDHGALLNHQVVAAAERLWPGDLTQLFCSGTTWQA